jgi:hypothetical protein
VNRLDTPTLDRSETAQNKAALNKTAHSKPAQSKAAQSEEVHVETAQIDCGYRNTSDRMVILRCCGPTEFYLERVVFPFEMLSFRCPPESEVEIWTHGLGGPELLETVHAESLLVLETVSVSPFHDSEENSPWWLQAS